MQQHSQILLALLGMNILAFLSYGLDKYKAKKGYHRISEFRLLLLALLGGWPGAWIGRIVFRHKTTKMSFVWKFYTVVLLNIAMTCAIYFTVCRAN